MLQIGVIEDTENRERLAKLLRFFSSRSEDDLTSLDAYVSRMKSGQKDIFYMAADNVEVGVRVFLFCLCSAQHLPPPPCSCTLLFSASAVHSSCPPVHALCSFLPLQYTAPGPLFVHIALFCLCSAQHLSPCSRTLLFSASAVHSTWPPVPTLLLF